ncbi:ceramide synthase 1 [Anolis carolinensis]|uniref:ceramide synthase 1 n=1 Tax=Anolis carolinensis TaxID=28377 RepID=UPI002F2B4AE5
MRAGASSRRPLLPPPLPRFSLSVFFPSERGRRRRPKRMEAEEEEAVVAAASSAGRAPEAMPGYGALAERCWGSLWGAARECGAGCGWAASLRTWRRFAQPAHAEALLVLLAALALTLARRAATNALLRPFAEWCQLPPKDAAKMPESAWKLAFYSASWSYSAYLLFFAGYPFFHDPPMVFFDWVVGEKVPTDIAMAYLLQCSFYVHSLYSTLYMDVWRKDSVVMLVHHVVTLLLLAFSYIFRYHKVGVLVIFLHDISDVQLEFTKLNVYFKYRGGVYHRLNDIISNAGCFSFGITWFWFRLYWFPLKVLYTTCHTCLLIAPFAPFYFFFNGLLFLLTLMNLYWFLYIAFFLAKVLLGQVREVDDVREYDTADGRKKLFKEGHHLKNGLVKDKRL